MFIIHRMAKMRADSPCSRLKSICDRRKRIGFSEDQHMKYYRPLSRILTVLFTLTASTHLVTAANFNWSGASGTDLNWLTPGNWSPSGPPASGDDAIFTDLGS